jgi:hypothetical protein
MTNQQVEQAAKLVAKLEQELEQAAAAQSWGMWSKIQEMLYNANELYKYRKEYVLRFGEQN